METLSTLQVDGPALANTTTATSLLGPATNVSAQAKYTFPANFWNIGKVLRMVATGRISNIVTTPGTLTFDLRMGGTTVWTGGAVALNTTAKTNVPWWLEALLTCRAVGPGTLTTFFGQGNLQSESVVGSAAGVANSVLLPASAPVVGTGVDGTASQQLDLFATWSIANAGNSLLAHSFTLQAWN